MGNYALKIAEGEALLKGGSLTLEEERAVHVSLALAFHEEGDEPRSLEEFLKAEALGDVDSSLILGYAYLGGRGIEKSVSKAKKHFLKALPSKNPWAYLGLVSLYASEVKDKKKTAYWFEKASQAGIVDAMLAYGEALLKGVVVEPHPLKGRKYLKMAALKGSPEAAYDLAKIYEDGDGVKIDQAKALSYYLIAAQGGYPPALFRLHEKGAHEAEPSKRTLEWVKLASRKDGPPLAEDLEEAFEKNSYYAKEPSKS
jgi:uncharacterized protein